MEIGEFGVGRPDFGGRWPRGEALGKKKKGDGARSREERAPRSSVKPPLPDELVCRTAPAPKANREAVEEEDALLKRERSRAQENEARNRKPEESDQPPQPTPF